MHQESRSLSSVEAEDYRIEAERQLKERADKKDREEGCYEKGGKKVSEEGSQEGSQKSCEKESSKGEIIRVAHVLSGMQEEWFCATGVNSHLTGSAPHRSH